MLYLAGIIISIYLLILFIAKPNKTIADRILTIWLFVATIHLGFLYLFVTGKYAEWPVLICWEMPLPLVHGPFLYLYTLYVTHQQQRKYSWTIHFITPIWAFIYWFPSIILPASEKLKHFTGPGTIANVKELIYIVVIIVSGISYIIASLVLLRKHKQNITSQFSYNEKINLNWLLYLIGGIGVIWMFVIFYRTNESLYISVSLFIFFIGFFGIRQQGIFHSHSQKSNKIPTVINPGVDGNIATEIAPDAINQKLKYERTLLSDNEADMIYTSLQNIMIQQKLFKNSELSLGDVAKIVAVPPAILSQVINTKAGKNFYDYINLLRINEFKTLIAAAQNEKYTLLSLAFECGFNSKSAFNRNFKKFTEQSPTEYLKLINTKAPNISY